MKSVARLTSSLLTRKGSAQPAVPAPHRVGLPLAGKASAPAKPVLLAKPNQRSTPDPRHGTQPGNQRGKKRVRVSLRLDLDRHRKLKLVAMQTGRTLQSLLTQALDDYFQRHTPEVLEALGPTEDYKAGNE